MTDPGSPAAHAGKCELCAELERENEALGERNRFAVQSLHQNKDADLRVAEALHVLVDMDNREILRASEDERLAREAKG